eukprot:g830.t1
MPCKGGNVTEGGGLGGAALLVTIFWAIQRLRSARLTHKYDKLVEPILSSKDVESQRLHAMTCDECDDSDNYSTSDGTGTELLWTTTNYSSQAEEYSTAQMHAATNSFADANKVDEGAFGIVYRGTLEDGKVVAIKLLKIERQLDDARAAAGTDPDAQPDLDRYEYSSEATFSREIEILGKYRHPNIVALLGHCMGDFAATGQTEKQEMRPCLIYEFMAGQSLKKRLADVLKLERAENGSLASASAFEALSWRERLNIASDVARGLAFLHTVANPPIIHQDVKSDNVLLGLADDGKLIAKLADFGTVRVLKSDDELEMNSHVSTKHLVGTGPYIPPEYVTSGQVSIKTDSYAFGVVLLELLTGKPPVNKTTRESLANEFALVLDNPTDDMPPRLDARAGGWPVDKAIALALVARNCLEPQVQRRKAVTAVRSKVDNLAGRS